MIEIYRGEDRLFHVRVDGQEIERLKSFSVSVSNARRPSGEYEAPSYCVEQYMAREKKTMEAVNRNFEDKTILVGIEYEK